MIEAWTPGNRLVLRMSAVMAVICAIRIAFAQLPAGDGTIRLRDLAFFTFVVSIPIAEFLILRKSAQEYNDYSIPKRHSDSFWYYGKSLASQIRFGKVLIGLFIFCLPYGLWATREQKDAVVPVLLGCAINLFGITAWASTLFKLKIRQRDSRGQNAHR
jgi:hypothetical protein